MTDQIIQLTGWTKVHTWNESHGNGHDDIYQRDMSMGGEPWSAGKVTLLTVCTRRGQSTSIRTETSSHDYLMANAIRANPTRYAPVGDRAVSPCCTAGHDDFSDAVTGDTYRVVSVAGHGEYAFMIDA